MVVQTEQTQYIERYEKFLSRLKIKMVNFNS